MARKTKKLTPMTVKNASKPGLYGDGGGLYLNIGPTGAKSWLFRFMLRGKSHEMGLGPVHTIGLGEARERALAARKLRLEGVDPLAAKRAEKVRLAAEAAAKEAADVTFKVAAEGYIAKNKAGWSNPKHAAQWSATLRTHVYPLIGNVRVADVTTGHVTRILEPIWSTKPETASRVRGRIEIVLDYAKVQNWRDGDNPARWRGHLSNAFPARSRVAKIAHHAALPWQQVGAFVTALEQQEGAAALALRLAILTAARTQEVIGATWGEIDMQAATWTIPAERMKARKLHAVPLPDAAMAILRQAAELRPNAPADAPVFPGRKVGSGMSNMAFLMMLRRMGHGDLTAHGFRSTFRVWAAENTKHEPAVVEMALAHAVGTKVEAAYQRSDLFNKRRALMNDWAKFCQGIDPAGDNVVPMRAAG